MIRKLMLGAAAVVAVGLAASTASAAPPIVVQPGTGGYYTPRPVPRFPQPGLGFPQPAPCFPQPRHDHDFVVFVKHFNHWDRYGRYETLREAQRVERLLEARGYRARIEIVEDRGRRW